jgi:RNA ligase (TIGR02306 family)
MSTHKVECVPVTLEKHPNADTLSIVRIFGGYTVVVRTEDWAGRDKGVYVEPDYIVPLDKPEFAFLRKSGETKLTSRIKTKKLRGVVSYGLLIPAPDGAAIGDDFMERYGITRYQPPEEPLRGNEACEGPNVLAPKYDLENWRKYSGLLVENELVYITEKIHGANARYVFHDGKMFCGSRTEWKKQADDNLWWKALTPNMEAFCRAHPGAVLYGEVYGQVGGFKYGNKGVRFAAFDVLQGGSWWTPGKLHRDLPCTYGVETVPLLYDGMYKTAAVEHATTGPSQVPGADHIREGCVIKPLNDRMHESIGRVALKSVSSEFLDKS